MKSPALLPIVSAYLMLSTAGFALPEIRDCKTEHYDISGDNGNDLLEEMRTKNETKGGYFAHTRYNYKSKCKELNLTCIVRLPRWSEFDSSTNAILKQKWEKFYVALVAHEQGHVDIFNEGMKPAAEGAEGLSCTAATKHFNAEFKKVSAAQKVFDAETDHGKKLGATFGGSSYMGIAYSAKSDAIGWAYDVETKEVASKAALKNCKAKDCKFIVWASGDNHCVSVARGIKGGYGYAHGEGREEAESKSVSTCNKFAKECSVRKTVCAGQGALE